MNQSAGKLPAWVPQAVRDDPKKAGVLSVLVLVLGVVLLKTLVFTGPSSATASTSPSKPGSGKAASNKAQAVEPVRVAPATRDWLKQPTVSLSRNLFVIRPEYFPSTQDRVGVVKAQQGATFWDAIEKSRVEQADQKKRRDILVSNLQREAAKLRLQSTVMGPEPQAIIGGSLVKEGDVVASDTSSGGVQFRVLAIETRRVIVEREGIRLAIHMQE